MTALLYLSVTSSPFAEERLDTARACPVVNNRAQPMLRFGRPEPAAVQHSQLDGLFCLPLMLIPWRSSLPCLEGVIPIQQPVTLLLSNALVLCVVHIYTMRLGFFVRMTVILAVLSGPHRLVRP